MQTKHSGFTPLAEIVCINPEHVKLVWPAASHFIKRVYERGVADDDFEDIEAKLFDGSSLLWLYLDTVVKAACVTELVFSGRKKLCIVLAAGADECDWNAAIKPIEEYAKEEGCEAVRMYGRKGWRRIFKDYDEAWVALEKRLNNGQIKSDN